jgi:phage/plasmid-associated DNA primase
MTSDVNPADLIEATAEAPVDPAFSDIALGEDFVTRHRDTLRYVAALGKWFHYDGCRWREENTLLAFDRARVVCRDAARRCNDAARKRIASKGTVASVEQLGRAHRSLAAELDQFDADPWALNTPKGVIDLRTGKLRPHRCELRPDGTVVSSVLYEAYRDWATAAGEHVLSHKAFSVRFGERLAGRGVVKEDNLTIDHKRGRGFRGIHLRPASI